jgi:hypothetical protein
VDHLNAVVMQNPAPEPNLEQTTPLLSLLLYSFLDSTIFKAYRMPHLPADEFPPLADYDYATNLAKRSFKVPSTFYLTIQDLIFFPSTLMRSPVPGRHISSSVY